MDLDEALEHVVFNGEIVQRPDWGPEDVIVKWWSQGQVGWRTTRIISCPDMVADDWKIVGRVQ